MNIQDFFYSLLDIVNEMSPYILLGFVIAGLLHVFVSQQAMSHHLSGKGVMPVIKAALLGIPLPLCSCGVLPTAVALRRQGAGKGATTSFLIATPQTGVDSIAATWSLLGLPFALVRPVAALAGACVGGYAVNRFDKDDTTPHPAEGSSSERQYHCDCEDNTYQEMSFGRKIIESLRYGLVDMVASVGKWLVIGLIVAAIITVAVPDTLFVNLSQYPLLAMAVMIIVAVPMYICATGSIPIALSLMMKGLSPGVAFVLLMAGPAANFASVILLGRTLGRRATAIYVGSVVVTAVSFGMLIDYLLPSEWFMPVLTSSAHIGCHHGEVASSHFPVLPTLCSVILGCLLVYAGFMSRHGHEANSSNNNINQSVKDMKQEFKVKGMSCAHCQATVAKAISRLEGVETVDVNLSSGIATVTGDVKPEMVKEAVYNVGFDIE